MAELDNAGLPYTDAAQISALRQEYEAAAFHGGRMATEKCFNLTWAMVHSRDQQSVRQGLELCTALLSGDAVDRRELLYLRGVGEFRLKHHLAARKSLKELLDEYPEFRQARALLDAVENEIVKDGLIGIGAGAAIVGVVAGIAVAVMKKR